MPTWFTQQGLNRRNSGQVVIPAQLGKNTLSAERASLGWGGCLVALFKSQPWGWRVPILLLQGLQALLRLRDQRVTGPGELQRDVSLPVQVGLAGALLRKRAGRIKDNLIRDADKASDNVSHCGSRLLSHSSPSFTASASLPGHRASLL